MLITNYHLLSWTKLKSLFAFWSWNCAVPLSNCCFTCELWSTDTCWWYEKVKHKTQKRASVILCSATFALCAAHQVIIRKFYYQESLFWIERSWFSKNRNCPVPLHSLSTFCDHCTNNERRTSIDYVAADNFEVYALILLYYCSIIETLNS